MTSISSLSRLSFPLPSLSLPRSVKIGGAISAIAVLTLLHSQPADAAFPAAAIPLAPLALTPVGVGFLVSGLCAFAAFQFMGKGLPANLAVRDLGAPIFAMFGFGVGPV